MPSNLKALQSMFPVLWSKHGPVSQTFGCPMQFTQMRDRLHRGDVFFKAVPQLIGSQGLPKLSTRSVAGREEAKSSGKNYVEVAPRLFRKRASGTQCCVVE